MTRTLTLFVRTWILGFTAYAFIWTRDVPTAYAIGGGDPPCPTLDQPNTTYQLTSNVGGNCIIAADNIILDGNGLYSISGSVTDNGNGYTFTLRNVPSVGGNVYAYAGLTLSNVPSVSGEAYAYSTLTITDSAVTGGVGGNESLVVSGSTIGYTYSGGDIDITDSQTTDAVRSGAGTISIINSQIDGEVMGYGAISITADSEVNGYIGNATSTTGTNITIEDSVIDATGNTVNGSGNAISGGNVTITDSTITGGGAYGYYSMDILRSTINADTYAYSHGALTIVDATVEGGAHGEESLVISGSTIGGYTYSQGDIEITDSQIAAEVLGYGTISISADSEVNGYVGGASTSTLITIEDSVIDATGNTYGGYAIYGGTLAVTNSTITGGRVRGEESITVSQATVGGYMYSNGDIEVTDSTITGGDVFGATLTVTDNPPELTVTPLTLELEHGESFDALSDVTANDIKDGDLSDNVIVTGSVGEEAGTYELFYSVTDQGTTLFNESDSATTTSGPSTASTTRTVTRLAAAEEHHSTATRVGRRSSSPSEDVAPTSDTASVEAILSGFKAVLSQSLTTTDPKTLEKILPLLRELADAVTKLVALSK